MRILKRAAALFAVTALAAALLTGCHGSKGRAQFEVPEHFDENQKIELTFWAKNDTNKTQTQIYEKAISDFEALYPNVDINHKHLHKHDAQHLHHLSGSHRDLHDG